MLQRDICFRPPPGSSLETNNVLHFLNTFNFLVECGDYEISNYRNLPDTSLQIQTTIFTLSFYFKTLNDTLIGLCAIHKDDKLHAVNESYSNEIQNTEKILSAKIKNIVLLSLLTFKLSPNRGLKPVVIKDTLPYLKRFR